MITIIPMNFNLNMVISFLKNNFFNLRILSLSMTFLFINLFFTPSVVIAYDSTIPWTSQGTGCSPVSNNVNAPLQVYLGIDNTVPSSIASQYPNAQAGLLSDFKTNIVGMKTNQFKSFIIPDGYGSNAPDPSLDNKDLFFEITVNQILINADSSGAATRSSVVNIHYSLYIDCSILSSSDIRSSTTSSSSVVSSKTTPPPDNTNFLILGGIFSVGALSVVGYILYSVRKPNLNTEKILEKTREKETVGIKNLKDSLGTNAQDSNIDTTTSKRPTSMRRRK